MVISPTRVTYEGLIRAYDHFNRELFDGRLPPCLFTMQRRRGSYGYFSPNRFGTRDEAETTDEIALNPTHFREQTVQASLSTLVHEMCHLNQQHFGKPSRGSYHNKEWASMMERVGLVPSDTSEPGGNRTGQSMSHYIDKDGPFATACATLLASGFELRYVERASAPDHSKAASKTTYTCPGCGAKAWAKPGLNFTHSECGEAMTTTTDTVLTELDQEEAG